MSSVQSIFVHQPTIKLNKHAYEHTSVHCACVSTNHHPWYFISKYVFLAHICPVSIQYIYICPAIIPKWVPFDWPEALSGGCKVMSVLTFFSYSYSQRTWVLTHKQLWGAISENYCTKYDCSILSSILMSFVDIIVVVFKNLGQTFGTKFGTQSIPVTRKNSFECSLKGTLCKVSEELHS